MSELIQTKLNLYLPSDDVVREKRPYNIFKKYPNLVIVSLTHPSVSKDTIFNLERSLYYLNYVDDPKDMNDVQQKIRTEIIDNADFSLTFLSYGLDIPINRNNKYNCYRYYSESYNSVVLKINSLEIKNKFPNLELAVLCEPAFLMRQLSEVKSIENGLLPINYYFKDGGLFIDKLRIQFIDKNVVNQNQSIIGYSKRRSEGKFVSRKNLIPGRVYTTSRTDYGTYFLYLGELDECLINKNWGIMNVFDWKNPYKAYICSLSNRNSTSTGDLNLEGSLIIEYLHFDQIDFHLKGWEFLSAVQSIIHEHNSSSINDCGIRLRLIPKASRLRGIEIDTLLQINNSFSPKDIIKNYVFDNIHNKVYDFPGYNIMSSLIWDEIKGEKDFINSLVECYAHSYLDQLQGHKMEYPCVIWSFISVTKLPGKMLDNAISKLSVPCP